MGLCVSHNQLTITEITDYQNLDYNRYSTYQKLEFIASNMVEQHHISAHYSSLIQRIIASRQDHILKILDTLQPDRKSDFMQELESVDIETIDSLFYNCYNQHKTISFPIKQISSNQYHFNKELGQQLIKNLQVGLIILAGGKSSRLKNKLLSDIGLPSQKCILEIMFERIKKILIICKLEPEEIKKYPIGVLISEVNGLAIKQFIRSKQQFGFSSIHYIYQKSLPLVNQDGKIQFQNNEPILYPDGCGNVYPQLLNFEQKYENLKYIHLIGCDNIMGLPLDPEMMGLQCDIICKVGEASHQIDDRLYFSNGQIIQMESQDCSMTDNTDNYKICLNDMYINVEFLQNLRKNHNQSIKLAQRQHSIIREQGIQFEKHIQDLMEVADSVILHQITDFSFIISDSQRAIIQLSNQHKKWLGIQGSNEEDLVEISPQISYNGENLKQIKIENIKYPLQI